MKNFNTIYNFHLCAGVNFVKMLNERVFAAVYNKDIQIGILPHLGIPFKISQNNVLSIIKRPSLTTPIIMILCNDNSIDIRNATRDSQLISIIYPPPTASLIVFMHFCRNRVFLMLDSGALCVFII